MNQLLLIEDNAGDARLIGELLRGELFHLTVCNTLTTGLVAAQQTDFDVVLLDLSLPDSTGLATLHTFHEQCADAPVVVLTGYDDEEWGVGAVQGGAQDYLVKDDLNVGLLRRVLRYARERHRIERAERQLAATLAATEERHRLARDLHDSVTQTLFTTSVMAESALMQWHNNPARAQQLIANVHQLSQSALAEMRVLLLELRPEAITTVDFDVLIGQLVDSLRSCSALEFDVRLAAVGQLPPAVQVGLYRIVQESLNNVIKHAQAARAVVWLCEHDGCIHLKISDDGIGFDFALEAENGLGIPGMHERAEQIGVLVNIDSTRQRGTSVSVAWCAQSRQEEYDPCSQKFVS